MNEIIQFNSLKCYATLFKIHVWLISLQPKNLHIVDNRIFLSLFGVMLVWGKQSNIKPAVFILITIKQKEARKAEQMLSKPTKKYITKRVLSKNQSMRANLKLVLLTTTSVSVCQ